MSKNMSANKRRVKKKWKSKKRGKQMKRLKMSSERRAFLKEINQWHHQKNSQKWQVHRLHPKVEER